MAASITWYKCSLPVMMCCQNCCQGNVFLLHSCKNLQKRKNLKIQNKKYSGISFRSVSRENFTENNFLHEQIIKCILYFSKQQTWYKIIQCTHYIICIQNTQYIRLHWWMVVRKTNTAYRADNLDSMIHLDRILWNPYDKP